MATVPKIHFSKRIPHPESMRIALSLFFITLSAWLGPHKAIAQELDSLKSRPITASVTFGMGSSVLRDTYLTPLAYKGNALGVHYERWRRSRHMNWANRQTLRFTFVTGQDANRYTETWAGRLCYGFASHIDLYQNEQSNILAGLYTHFDGGFNYNLKLAGSNSPATARLVNNYGLSVVTNHRYTLRGKPCDLMLQASTPLVGWAFAPEFGESYYEHFYLQQQDGYRLSPTFTSLHRQQELDLRLTTDIPLSIFPWWRHKHIALRTGIDYHIETARIHHITTRLSTFEWVIGWTFKHLSIPTTYRTKIGAQ